MQQPFVPPTLPEPSLHRVPFNESQEISVQDYAGSANHPAVVLLHGFPDNHHLYERVIPPLLAAKRRVVTLDFIGWGGSTKPSPTAYRYTHTTWTQELQAVVNHLQLTSIIVVSHDSSGPTGVDIAIQDSERPPLERVVKGLVMLNSYYNRDSGMLKPTAIWLFSTSLTRPVAYWLSKKFPAVMRAIYTWQVSQFFHDKAVAEHYVPRFFADFPNEFDAMVALNRDLNTALAQRNSRQQALRAAMMSEQVPVIIQFGVGDRFLNPEVAKNFKKLLPHAQLLLVQEAKHYVQMDQPQQVAEAILSIKQNVND